MLFFDGHMSSYVGPFLDIFARTQKSSKLRQFVLQNSGFSPRKLDFPSTLLITNFKLTQNFPKLSTSKNLALFDTKINFPATPVVYVLLLLPQKCPMKKPVICAIRKQCLVTLSKKCGVPPKKVFQNKSCFIS